MQKASSDWDRVPACVGKQFGVSRDSFDDYGIRFHGENRSTPDMLSPLVQNTGGEVDFYILQFLLDARGNFPIHPQGESCSIVLALGKRA